MLLWQHSRFHAFLSVQQGVRSLSRFYLILFLPVFFGPYWSWVAELTNFGFSFFFSILVHYVPTLLPWCPCLVPTNQLRTALLDCLQLQMAVTGLVNVTISLEGA